MPLLPSIPEQTALGPMLRRFPIADNALLEYRNAIMFADEPLGTAECELIATYVSALNRCGYCRAAHGVFAEAHGIDRALLAELADDPGRIEVDARLAALFALLEKLTLAPSAVEAGDAARAGAAGWSSEEIGHAVSVCAFFNGVNRIAEGTGIDKTPPDVAVVREQTVRRPARRIDATGALLRHHAGSMRGPSPLSIGEREMLACLVSALNGCRRGADSHRAMAEAAGVPSAATAALFADPQASRGGSLTSLAAYVRTLTATPGRLGRAEAQAVFDAGWSEEALFHAVSVCALANLLNRLIDCPGVATDPALCMLYDPSEKGSAKPGMAMDRTSREQSRR